MEETFKQLSSTLYRECIDTQLITAEQWNEAIAPKMRDMEVAIRLALSLQRNRIIDECEKEIKRRIGFATNDGDKAVDVLRTIIDKIKSTP